MERSGDAERASVCGLGAMTEGVVDVLDALDMPEELVRVQSNG